METNRVRAVLKCYIPTRAFGFLNLSDGREIFFHKENFVGDITKIVLGGEVEFEFGPAIKMGKPPMAVKVCMVETGLNSLASADTAKAAE